MTEGVIYFRPKTVLGCFQFFCRALAFFLKENSFLGIRFFWILKRLVGFWFVVSLCAHKSFNKLFFSTVLYGFGGRRKYRG